MIESKNTAEFSESASAGLSLSDIYYVVFRRKWIILSVFVLGLVGAGVLFVVKKPLYRSDSKLLVRYVLESKSPVPLGDNSQVRNPDSGGGSIIASEIEILTSLDLCIQVAEAIGPERILKSAGGGDSKIAAGAEILNGITVEPNGNIIKVTFRHPNADVITPVLEALIDGYLKRHAEIHRGLGSLDIVLSRESDQLKSQLNETEEKLRALKSTNGVISLEETKNSYIEEMSNLRRELFNSEAALAEALATVAATPTNGLSTTNSVSISSAQSPDVEIPIDALNQYKEAVSRLGALRNSLFALELQFRDENPLVKRAREHVADVDRQKRDLETRYPNLIKLPTATIVTPSEPSIIAIERMRVVALQAKVRTLKTQLESIRSEAARLDQIEAELKQLQRKRDLEETNFRYFSAGLERSRFDETLGSSRNNISVVQRPTPPRKDDTKRLKMIAGVLGSGLAAGFALAFLLELFLDQTVRRPAEVESRLHIPLFMAVPYANGKAMRRLVRNGKKSLANGNAKQEGAPLQPATAWELNHPLRPTFEGLRDRMANHFKNVAHKPKLVGISTCSPQAGATTLAAGVAAALSETGEGKVLLVDLHQPKGAAHPFFQGKHVCEIDDALEQAKRQAGMVQENLYMALANDGMDRRLGLLSKQFSSLVPKLKASDYDYIIFDMPRVSATSPTLRLAGMMDLTLLVVEAGKVSRDAVKQGYSLLVDAGTDARVVLNKVRTYVPAKLSGDL